MTLIDLDTLPRCEVCGVRRLPDTAICLYCRAVTAEGQLARLSVWGEDDWMRRLASLTLGEDRRSHEALTPIGFECNLHAAQPVRLHVRPQMAFRPEMLTVAPDCAHLGTLLDVQIGNRSQLVSPEPIPLSIFNPQSWTSVEMMQRAIGRLEWDTASVAVNITLNLSLAACEPLIEEARAALTGLPPPTKFRAALWGRAVGSWARRPPR